MKRKKKDCERKMHSMPLELFLNERKLKAFFRVQPECLEAVNPLHFFFLLSNKNLQRSKENFRFVQDYI